MNTRHPARDPPPGYDLVDRLALGPVAASPRPDPGVRNPILTFEDITDVPRRVRRRPVPAPA